MSLTENYIVPDFYYTDSGIPTLYNTNNISNSEKFESNIGKNLNIVQNTRTQSPFTPILNQSTSIWSSSRSQSSPSISSSILFKNSLSPKSYNYSNNNSQQKTTTTLSSTPILKCCKSTTTTTTRSTTSREIPTTAINFNRLRNRNNDNNNNNNNNCDKINQNSFKINTPKKLLIKRGTIYQNDPQPPPPSSSSSSLPIQTTQKNIVVANTVTGLVATGKKIQKTSNNRNSNNCVNSYYNNNGNTNGNNNYNNCGNNENKNNEILNWGFINDKQRKTYVNNQIKKFQNINEQRLRGNDQNHAVVPQLSQSSRSQFQSTSSGNHLYCPKNGSVIIKKFQQNNNNNNNQQQNQMDNRITYYNDHRNYEIFGKNKNRIQNNIKNNNWNNCSSSHFIYRTDFYNIKTTSSSDVDNTLNNNSTNRDHIKEDDYYDDNENTYYNDDAVLNQNEYDDDDLNDF